MVHFDPPNLFRPGCAKNERACDGKPVGIDREHGATGVVRAVTCRACIKTKAFRVAANLPDDVPDEKVHWHRSGEPLWACGIRQGQATGSEDQVTCPECRAQFPEDQHGDREVVSVHEPEVPGEERGEVSI
jgi:hypothetical protein